MPFYCILQRNIKVIKSIAIVLSLVLHSLCLYSLFSLQDYFKSLEKPKHSNIFIYKQFIIDNPSTSRHLEKSQPQKSQHSYTQKEPASPLLKNQILKQTNLSKIPNKYLPSPNTPQKEFHPIKTPPDQTHGASEEINTEGKEVSHVPLLSSTPVSISQNGFQGEYPYISYKHREQGDVKLQFQWHYNGYPINIDIIQSSGFKDLDRAAVEALYHPFPDLLAVLKENITYETIICFTLESMEDETFN